MLVFRKSTSSYHSIENVFKVLLPFFNVNIFELPHVSKGFFNRVININSLIRQKYKYLHISGNDHYLLWYPFKKSILTIHDIESLKRKKGLKKKLFKLLWFDIPIRNAKALTTVSEFSKNEILSLGNFKTPIRVINNPLTLPLNFFEKTFNSKEPRILHIGTKENKNLFRTIMALKGINCNLIIIGKSDKKILKLLNAIKINYVFKLDLSNEEVIEEYKKCDLVSFISTYEGFGLPIIEAQAIGRAVLTSNTSSMPEVAGDGALFVDPYSINEIKNGFIKLIEDDKYRSEVIEIGLVNVKRFQPKKIANQYLDLYSEILSNA